MDPVPVLSSPRKLFVQECGCFVCEHSYTTAGHFVKRCGNRILHGRNPGTMTCEAFELLMRGVPKNLPVWGSP